MNDAEVTPHLASSQSDGVSHVQGTLTTSSETLIRTIDGQVTFWSPDLEQRSVNLLGGSRPRIASTA
jgi:hypothetical protein